MSKRQSREFYDWCPHSTFNPMGCGVCGKHRKTIERAEAADKLESDLRAARATALEQETRAQNAEMALATLRTRLAGSVHHSDLRKLVASWDQHMPAAECASELASVCDVLEGDERRAGQDDGIVRAVAGPCDVDGREVVS